MKLGPECSVEAVHWRLEGNLGVGGEGLLNGLGVERRRHEYLDWERDQEVEDIMIDVRAEDLDVGAVEVGGEGRDLTAATVEEDVRRDRIWRVEVALKLALQPLNRDASAESPGHRIAKQAHEIRLTPE